MKKRYARKYNRGVAAFGKDLYSLIGKEDVLNSNAINVLTEEDSQFIDLILDNYASFNASDLERMTHKEKPWLEARKGYGQFERCTNIISKDTMIEYYGNRWAELTDEAKSKTLLQANTSAAGKRLEKGNDKSQLSFSFQYFRQIPCFQLGEQDNKWFVSVLDRLKDLSGKNSSLMADATAKKPTACIP